MCSGLGLYGQIEQRNPISHRHVDLTKTLPYIHIPNPQITNNTHNRTTIPHCTIHHSIICSSSQTIMSHRTLATAAVVLSSCNTCIAFISPTLHTAKYSTFSSPSAVTSSIPSSTTRLQVISGSPDAPKTIEEDAALQWEMFTRHHALDGEWWGTWSTYNYMGDLEDSTVAG